MGVKPGKKSIGSGGMNTSMGGGAGTPKSPDNKRKSLPKSAPATPSFGAKKQAPAAPPSPKKDQKVTSVSPTKLENKPAMKKGGGTGGAMGISAQLSKVSDQSKTINKASKKNRNKQNRFKGKGNKNQDNKPKEGGGGDKKVQQSAAPGAGAKMSKKNRRQRLQAQMSAKPRSPLSQSRALKAEQELNKTSNRVLHVKLPDPPITNDMVMGWSSNIENAMFYKAIEPRSFLVVLKPDANVKKEIEILKKVSFGAGKLIVQERQHTDYEGKNAADGLKAEDFIDPYTLYLTNLDEAVTRSDLQTLFPQSSTVMNPRKHNPRVTGSGTATKFAFVGFETADAAFEGFKMCFNKKFVNDKFIVVRFRRVSKGDVKVEKKPADATAAVKRKAEDAAPAVKGQPLKKEDAKKSKLIKEEPEEDEDDDDDDDDDEEEDDDEDEDEDDDSAVAFPKAKNGVEVEDDDDDDSEDDESDGLHGEEDSDDDDEDDDDE